MIVIGIDPASGKKGSHLFAPEKDGLEKRGLDAQQLRSMLDRLREEHQDLLLCWDSPLSGPQHPDAEVPGDLIMRDIEKRYRPQTKEVPGVSVLGYAGLTHWVVSRNVLGLPRVGNFDAKHEDLPFSPCFSDEPPRLGHHVVEVHPTLAAWVWLGDAFRSYKGTGSGVEHERAAMRANWAALLNLAAVADAKRTYPHELQLPLEDKGLDDALDARISWLLGWLWLQGSGAKLEGSEIGGAFLMPEG